MSKELSSAWKQYNKAFETFRVSGKPSDKTHPARKARDEARDELRRIKREEQRNAAQKLHNELMETHKGNISKVPQKLRKIRGDKGNPPISSIETLVGEFTGGNVLEGFRANAEKLSTPANNENFCSDIMFGHL